MEGAFIKANSELTLPLQVVLRAACSSERRQKAASRVIFYFGHQLAAPNDSNSDSQSPGAKSTGSK